MRLMRGGCAGRGIWGGCCFSGVAERVFFFESLVEEVLRAYSYTNPPAHSSLTTYPSYTPPPSPLYVLYTNA